MVAAPVLALVGPTASGKSEAGVVVAEALGAQIVSVDSMLVYRGMNVGTAKPGPELRARVRHHLVDVAEPEDPFTVAEYQRMARAALAGIAERGARALLVGGSGLYFRAVVDDLRFPGTEPDARRQLEAEATILGPGRMYARLAAMDPVAAGKIQPGNVRRTVRALEVAAVTGRPFSSYAEGWARYAEDRVRVGGIDIPRPVLAARIEVRVREMLERGFLDEVRGLVHRGLGEWLTASQAIGYAEFTRHLAGELTLDEAIEATVKRTRVLAKRQLAWFRRDPRIRWFPAGEGGAMEIIEEIVEYLKG